LLRRRRFHVLSRYRHRTVAQTIPLVGALGGAAVNYIEHFQSIVRGHFIVRRLERTYGDEQVYAAYEGIERDLD
jgi:hypothetical protein